MKKVLIALDYDPTSKTVAEQGYSIAQSMDAVTILLHVITDPVYYASSQYSPIIGFEGYMEMEPFQFDTIEGVRNASEHFLDKYKKHLGNKTIETMVMEGDFADSILAAAKGVHADMIVMGSHSHKWLENIVIGSVTEKVLRHTKLPLLIIPTKKH